MKNHKCDECMYGSYYSHFANLYGCDLIKNKICTIEYLQAHCPLKDNPTLDDEYEKLNDEYEKMNDEYEKGVDKMNDNEMIKTIDDMIRQWGIKIKDDMERMLSEKPFDKYDFDTITSFECLEDDVTRLNKIAILHDMLISLPTEELVDLFKKHGIDVE